MMVSTSSLSAVGRCECNEGCDAPVTYLKPNETIWYYAPEDACKAICADHGGWSGRWTNRPSPRPYC
ncbi:MAG: hypothetical protein WA432_02505 [Candidatus Babeliaceae bacterium]